MRKLLIPIVGCFLFLFIVPFLSSGDRKSKRGKQMEFLKEIKWGIGKEETRVIFRDKESIPPHPTQNAIGFIDSIYGAPAGIVCYFKGGLFSRDKLVRVVVHFFKELPEDDIIEKKYTQIKRDLVAQYGRPAHEVEDFKDDPLEFRLSELLVWVVGDSILTLSLGLKRDGVIEDNSGIFVGCGDAKRDPISQQWNSLKAK